MSSQRYEHTGPFFVEPGKITDHYTTQQAQGWELCAAYLMQMVGPNGPAEMACLFYKRPVGHWQSQYVSPP